MSHRYSTALSHLVLFVITLLCLIKFNGTNLNGAHGTYGVILINSILGIWKWGNPEYGFRVYKIYRLTSYLQTLLTLPFIVAAVWLFHGCCTEVALLHIFCPLVPLISHFLYDEAVNIVVIHGIVGINCLSLIFFSYQTEAYFGIATAVSYAFNHFIVKNEGCFLDIVPAQDMYNYGLCFFNIFAWKTLSETGIVPG